MSSGEANVTIEVKIDEDSGGKTGKIIVRGESLLSYSQEKKERPGEG